jgi:hypothetical protein|tara:strand:- start:356 stop:622 length:267 start_codon:yes stop_codon:yes gene_type:complete
MPVKVEVKMAIREATRMHLHQQDPYYLGKTMLRQSYRLKLLEKVLAKTEAYILSGEGGREEAELIATINKINISSPIANRGPQGILIY